MERTVKIKISLGVLLVLLVIRFILGFFPEPLEFAPYSPDGKTGELQTVTFSEILYCMTVSPENGTPMHYYQVQTTDGNTAVISSATKYYDEVFQDPLTFTGAIVRLTDPNNLDASYTETFYSTVTVSEVFLSANGGDKVQAYRTIANTAVLNRDYTETTRENPASFWVSLLAFGAFCVMLAFLLKEYVGGRRAKKKQDAEDPSA